MSTIADRLAFVICPPRAGSTMLSRMLTSHSSIYASLEPHLLAPLHQLGYYGSVEESGMRGGVMAYEPKIVRSAIQGVVEQLPGGELDYLDALRAYSDTIYSRLLEGSGRKLFVDKTPRNSLFIDFILKLYPSSRFIVLTRHPLAIAHSLRGMLDLFGKPKHLSPDESLYVVMPEMVQRIARCLNERPVEICHVRFEDLVSRPEDELERVCSFLGLPMETRMVEYGKIENYWNSRIDPFTTSVRQHNRPHPSFIHKWREEVASNADELVFMQTLLPLLPSEAVEAWGYSSTAMVRELKDLVSTDKGGPVT